MMLVYAIRDVKENAFGQLLLFRTDAAASRAFEGSINKADGNPYNSNPTDFELYQVAGFDDDTGLVEGITPRMVVRGDSLVRSTE